MRIRYLQNALRQLDPVLDHAEARNPQAARDFNARLHAAADLLAAYPMTGQTATRPGQRRLVTNPYPYAIFYRVTQDEVVIQRIRHTSRRPI